MKKAIALCAAFAALGAGMLPGAAVRPKVTLVDHAGVLKLVAANPGKPTLVNIWATWCGPCREEMPELLKLRSDFAAKGVHVVLVSADDGAQADSVAGEALAKFGVDFETYVEHDSSDETFINGIDSSWSGTLPTTFVFDGEGKLAATLTGGKTYKQFAAALRSVLK